MYGEFEIAKAYQSMALFVQWQMAHDIKVIDTELQLVSEKYKYGGTIDLLAEVDGKITIVDFKTGSGIYAEHYYQICSYRQLVKECMHIDVKQVRILNIPRDGIDKFTEMVYNEFTTGWEIFKCCKKIYELQKKGGF
jgi:ATP-dependent exoDNAse (exonuclease V) beta subunit